MVGEYALRWQEELWSLRVHRSVLERVRIPAERMRSLVTVLLEDDAMGPEMPRGTLVTADRDQSHIVADCTYAPRLGERAVVRFVHSRLDGEVEVSGFNPRWPAETVGTLKASQLSVVGRVVGVLKRMA